MFPYDHTGQYEHIFLSSPLSTLKITLYIQHTALLFFSTQSSEPGSDIIQRQESSDKEFKISIINLLEAVLEKVGNTQYKMGNHGREMETIRKNKNKY